MILQLPDCSTIIGMTMSNVRQKSKTMMHVGIFADSHDHLINIRLAVERFNRERCDYVLFAGDLVSTIAMVETCSHVVSVIDLHE